MFWCCDIDNDDNDDDNNDSGDDDSGDDDYDEDYDEDYDGVVSTTVNLSLYVNYDLPMGQVTLSSINESAISVLEINYP